MDINRLNIIENYKNPSNFGKLQNFTNTATVSNLSCGDELTVYIIIEKDVIKDIKFEGSGCSISIATMSILTETLKGQNISMLGDLNLEFIQNEILKTQISSGRYKCASIGMEALKNSILP